MDHSDWAICACLKFKDGELLDKSRPFATYHIEAPTAKKAIEKLKKAFDYYDIIFIESLSITLLSKKSMRMGNER